CFRQNRVGFVSPKSVAVPVRAQVARVIVNNNRKQWIGARKRLLQPEVGSSFSVISISRFQTAHLVPAAHFLHPGFATLLRQPESRVGGAPICRPYILMSPQVTPGYFPGLAFSYCNPPHAASTILRVHRLEPG